MSTSATKDCVAELDHAEEQMHADLTAFFNQLREHARRNDGRLTFVAMESRHEPIRKCVTAFAKQAAEVFHSLAAFGTDKLDDFREHFTAFMVGGWGHYYNGTFEEVVSDAEAERQERNAA